MSLNDKLKDNDLKSMELTDDDLESVAGGSKKYVPCPKCNTKGKLSDGSTCPKCGGLGTISKLY